MWDRCLQRLESKLHVWHNKYLPFAGKLTIHPLGLSCLLCIVLVSQQSSILTEHILRSYLWYKYDGVRGFPLVAWDVSIMPKDEGGLGMIDFAAQGSQYSGNQVGG